jgi:hypothetical protein
MAEAYQKFVAADTTTHNKQHKNTTSKWRGDYNKICKVIPFKTFNYSKYFTFSECVNKIATSVDPALCII